MSREKWAYSEPYLPVSQREPRHRLAPRNFTLCMSAWAWLLLASAMRIRKKSKPKIRVYNWIRKVVSARCEHRTTQCLIDFSLLLFSLRAQYNGCGNFLLFHSWPRPTHTHHRFDMANYCVCLVVQPKIYLKIQLSRFLFCWQMRRIEFHFRCVCVSVSDESSPKWRNTQWCVVRTRSSLGWQ